MSQQKSYTTTPKLKLRYNISDMTVWRWEHDDKLNFPKPIIINRRKYWDEASLDDWDRRQADLSRKSKPVAA